MNRKRTLTFILVVGIGILVAGAGLSGTGNVAAALRSTAYDLAWWTVDGGGATVAGGGYSLTGTAGQPEPGPAVSGGGYTLISGFWPGGGEAAPACPIPLTGVSLSGPTSGATGDTLGFTAAVQPSNASSPISYTWSTDGLVSGQNTASATYLWDSAGNKTVQVTARNCGGQDFIDSQPVSITTPGEGTCANPLPLSCGEQVGGDTTGRANNISSYTCSSWNESGPEAIYSFALGAGATYTVSAALTGLSVDLDVFLLSECSTGQCATSGSVGNLTAVAGDLPPGTYYVSVDGYQGAVGGYTLTLTCIPTSVCDHPLTGVNLSGPSSGATGQDLVFTASPLPGNATGPILYAWSSDGLVSGQGTASATYRWDSSGTKPVQVTARNCGGEDFVDSLMVDISMACTKVTGVDLSLLTTDEIYTDTVVSFSADIAPDSAGKPFTYTIDFSDGHSVTSTSSDDPLSVPLTHTYSSVGTYEVEIKVWNCDMAESEAETGSVQVEVVERPIPCTDVTGVTLSLLTTGDIYTDTVVSLSADVAPDNATKPYTYSIDYKDGHSITSTSSDDPLSAPLDHTFESSGTYDPEIRVWNCEMAEGEAASGSVQVIVRGYGPADKHVYMPLVIRNR